MVEWMYWSWVKDLGVLLLLTMRCTRIKVTRRDYWSPVNRRFAVFLSAPFGSRWCCVLLQMHMVGRGCTMRVPLFNICSTFNASQPLPLSEKLQLFCASMISWVCDSLTGRSQFVHPARCSVWRGGQWSFTWDRALAFSLHLIYHRLSEQLWATSPAEVFWRLSLCQVSQGVRGGRVQDTGRQLCRVNWTESPKTERLVTQQCNKGRWTDSSSCGNRDPTKCWRSPPSLWFPAAFPVRLCVGRAASETVTPKDLIKSSRALVL